MSRRCGPESEGLGRVDATLQWQTSHQREASWVKLRVGVPCSVVCPCIAGSGCETTGRGCPRRTGAPAAPTTAATWKEWSNSRRGAPDDDGTWLLIPEWSAPAWGALRHLSLQAYRNARSCRRPPEVAAPRGLPDVTLRDRRSPARPGMYRLGRSHYGLCFARA
jgi:hypothetical protein